MPGCYSDWLLAERDRLAQAYGAALERLATLYEAQRDYPKAIGHAQALLRHDPLHEPAYAQLMRLHALNDDRAAALHTYHTCVTVLRRELDVAPGPATREIYERLLNASVQPSASPPEAAIPLIGREAEWAQLQRAWRDARGRPGLALIAGEVGIGKTRLAEALVEWVARQGIPVLAARGYAAGGELAYAPVAAWLRSGPRPPLAAPWLRELGRLLPELLVEQPDLPPPEPLTEKWQRTRLFEALAHAVLTGRRALLLFLDDLQWCDRDTLDWLAYLLQADAARNGAVQLLVVATLRQGEGDEAALASWVAGQRGAGRLTEIELGRCAPKPRSRWPTASPASRSTGRWGRCSIRAPRAIRFSSSRWCAPAAASTCAGRRARGRHGRHPGDTAGAGAPGTRRAAGAAFAPGAEHGRAGGRDRPGLHLRRPGARHRPARG